MTAANDLADPQKAVVTLQTRSGENTCSTTRIPLQPFRSKKTPNGTDTVREPCSVHTLSIQLVSPIPRLKCLHRRQKTNMRRTIGRITTPTTKLAPSMGGRRATKTGGCEGSPRT